MFTNSVPNLVKIEAFSLTVLDIFITDMEVFLVVDIFQTKILFIILFLRCNIHYLLNQSLLNSSSHQSQKVDKSNCGIFLMSRASVDKIIFC